MNTQPVPETTDHPASPREGSPPIPPSGAVRADIAGLSHRGLVRPNNEDNYLVARFGRFLQTISTSLSGGQVPGDLADAGYGMVVADGMGGMAGGEIASRMAIALFLKLVMETPDWILSRDEPWVTEVMDRTARRFRDVNEAILEATRARPELRGMGTTLTLAVSFGADLIVAHVGDSPVYLSRRGELHRLTRDHTLARRMADLNAVDPRDVSARFRHVLTHAIGIQETGSEPDVERYWLDDGDRLLLCTDGLTDMVDDEMISGVLNRQGSSDEACRALIDLALGRGGKDNVTAVVATYGIPRAVRRETATPDASGSGDGPP